MPIPANQDYEFYRGDNEEITLVYKDDSGVVIDITGATAKTEFRQFIGGSVILTKTATIDGAAGEMVFSFTTSDTIALATNNTVSRYVYDIELTDVSGVVTTLLAGSVTVQADVTRA